MLAYVVDLTVRYIIVSSAKSRTLLLTESGRSFIYARKRHGPYTDPCGTPDTTGNVSEVHPYIRTCWMRHCKNDLIHRVFNFIESFTEIHYNYICLIAIFKVVIDLLRKTDKLRFTTVF